MAGRRLAIIGAGPIGLEAAVRGQQSGWDVTLLEQGTIGNHVAAWGHVRLFSPFGMNASAWGREALAGQPLPADDALLTGREFVDQYLLPLSQSPLLSGRIRDQTRVVAISRGDFWKSDRIGQPSRSESAFRLLVESRSAANDEPQFLHPPSGTVGREARAVGEGVTLDGASSQSKLALPARSSRRSQVDGEESSVDVASVREEIIEADVVFDCSGTFSQHNWLGAGGIPCPGERASGDRIDYQIPDICGSVSERFAGKTTLVVGAGYSAATSVVALSRLAVESPQTRCLWLTRTDRTPPVPVVEDDQLAGRAALTRTANELAIAASDAPSPVQWINAARIEEIQRTADDRLAVRIRHRAELSEVGASEVTDQSEELIVDRIIAQVGYRPDRSMYEELQIHECYASQGPIKLAAALLGEMSGDCLSQTAPGADTLRNPEPGFFILGAKSYGRDSRFLIRIGLEQIEAAFSLLETPSK